jgi:hypothetical protein
MRERIEDREREKKRQWDGSDGAVTVREQQRKSLRGRERLQSERAKGG